jgi:tRNA uridine 5-carboxymethylaminomethyl modification enzyme
VDYDALVSLEGVGAPPAWQDARLATQVALQVEVQSKYAGYIDRQQQEIDRHRRHEETRLPPDIDYALVAGLSNEARQRLAEARPDTLGQASRLPGITPAAISLLLVHLKRGSRAA